MAAKYYQSITDEVAMKISLMSRRDGNITFAEDRSSGEEDDVPADFFEVFSDEEFLESLAKNCLANWDKIFAVESTNRSDLAAAPSDTIDLRSSFSKESSDELTRKIPVLDKIGSEVIDLTSPSSKAYPDEVAWQIRGLDEDGSDTLAAAPSEVIDLTSPPSKASPDVPAWEIPVLDKDGSDALAAAPSEIIDSTPSLSKESLDASAWEIPVLDKDGSDALATAPSEIIDSTPPLSKESLDASTWEIPVLNHEKMDKGRRKKKLKRKSKKRCCKNKRRRRLSKLELIEYEEMILEVISKKLIEVNQVSVMQKIYGHLLSSLIQSILNTIMNQVDELPAASRRFKRRTDKLKRHNSESSNVSLKKYQTNESSQHFRGNKNSQFNSFATTAGMNSLKEEDEVLFSEDMNILLDGKYWQTEITSEEPEHKCQKTTTVINNSIGSRPVVNFEEKYSFESDSLDKIVYPDREKVRFKLKSVNFELLRKAPYSFR